MKQVMYPPELCHIFIVNETLISTETAIKRKGVQALGSFIASPTKRGVSVTNSAAIICYL